VSDDAADGPSGSGAREHERLPGVSGPESVTPVRRVEAALPVRKARRAANLKDLVDAILLIAVDVLVVKWPAAHIPGLSRHSSFIVLIWTNVAFLAIWYLARIWPRMRARRIAASWNQREQNHLERTVRPPRRG
jgi:hypothetical protein